MVPGNYTHVYLISSEITGKKTENEEKWLLVSQFATELGEGEIGVGARSGPEYSPSSRRCKYSACRMKFRSRQFPSGDHFQTACAIVRRESPVNRNGSSSSPDGRSMAVESR